MSSRINWKVVVIAALLGCAFAGGESGWVLLTTLFFGILNAVLVVPGTIVIRAVSVVAAAITLLGFVDPPVIAVLGLWIWPPAFLSGWAIARSRTQSVERMEPTAGGQRARNTVAVAIAAIGCAVLLFEGVTKGGLQQTALLFVGIPTLLGIVVTLGVPTRTATGVACKAVTIGLLVSLIFLGEGFLCIAMSAPLFYAIAVLVAQAASGIKGGTTARRATSRLMLLTLMPMSVEGTTPLASFDRDELVTVTKTIDASFDDVSRALLETPRFDRALPAYLRMGFPRPIATEIDARGSRPRWVVRLRGGETRLNGTEPKTGDLLIELDEARPGFVHWIVLADGSHMTHFLRWRESTVRWEAVGPGTTRVTWTLRYRRGLDPAWYFGPWERYAVGLAAGYLIDAVAMP